MLSLVGPFFKEGRGSRKFWPEAEIFGIFSIEVTPNCLGYWFGKFQIPVLETFYSDLDIEQEKI